MPELELSRMERLIIDRRRRKENQDVAAARMGVSESTYGLWERGKHKNVPVVDRITKGEELSRREVAFISRCRAKLTQVQLAEKMGYSAEWVKKMERGEVNGSPLFTYWKIK